MSTAQSIVYWAAHAGLLLAYPILRSYYPDAPLQGPSKYLPFLTGEFDIVIVAALLVAQRFRRSCNIVEFIRTVVTYAELTVAFLLVITDLQAGAAFCIACTLVWITLRDSTASLLARACGQQVTVQFITLAELKALLVSPRRARDAGVRASTDFFVLFTPTECDAVVYTFSAVARQYAASTRRFVAVSIDSNPQCGDLVDLDLGVFSLQTPSVFRIKAGQVVSRLPVVNTESGSTTSVVMSAGNIATFFDL